MRIVLDQMDFRQLSEAAQKEVIALLNRSVPASKEDRDESFIELPFSLLKTFMGGVSEKTKSYLRLFAENGGRASLENINALLGGTSDVGIRAGISRRIRGIVNDPEAYLIDWDRETEEFDEEGELKAGEWVMTPITTSSLKKYFNIA